MSRRSFTKALAQLINYIIEDGSEPIIDYVIRSAEEQQRLYSFGRVELPNGLWIDSNSSRIITQCDGFKKRSKHQSGLAADIYIVLKNEDGSFNVDYNWSDTAKRDKYHKKWEELGGDTMIAWDAPHFQFKE